VSPWLAKNSCTKSKDLTSKVLINALPAILWKNRIEIEFALSRYGFSYHTGLSVRIFTRQISPAFEMKGKVRFGQFIGHSKQMINWQLFL